jgi:TetR/AcrR family transcriptional repressor of mexJK operon
LSQAAHDSSERADRPSKRDLIVGAARKLFLGSGYGAVSMDAIAAEAGVSKRTVYSHFQNKETLFGAIISDMCAEMGGPNATDFAVDQSPEEVLKAYGQQILKMVLNPEALAVFRVVLSKLQEAGVLDVGDPATAANQFINMVKGPYFTSLLFGVGTRPTNEEAERSLDQAVSIFLKGARK